MLKTVRMFNNGFVSCTLMSNMYFESKEFNKLIMEHGSHFKTQWPKLLFYVIFM